MKIVSTVILVAASYCMAITHTTPEDLILTKEQNDKWISDLEKAPKAQQIDMMKQRLLLDTNVYIPQRYADRIKVDHEKLRRSRMEGYGKPALIISGHFIDINNNTKSSSVVSLTQYLTDKEVTAISILTDAKAAAIYGSRAICGVIIIDVKKKTTKRILKINFAP